MTHKKSPAAAIGREGDILFPNRSGSHAQLEVYGQAKLPGPTSLCPVEPTDVETPVFRSTIPNKSFPVTSYAKLPAMRLPPQKYLLPPGRN
jgi:hypothetical protein